MRRAGGAGAEFPADPSYDPFRALDASLSCSICYGLFDVPLVLTSCGHSFCSACIRQNLEFQEHSGQPGCPSCRKPCDARDLQPNVALRDVVERYRAARPLAARLAVDCLDARRREAERQEQEQQQEGAAAGPTVKGERRPSRRTGAPAEEEGAQASSQQAQQQDAGGQRSKLRPRSQQQQPAQQPPSSSRRAARQPASAARQPPGGGGGRLRQQRAGAVAAGHKRRRPGGGGSGGKDRGLPEGSGSDGASEAGPSSGSEFVVEVEEGSEWEGSAGEAIDLVDSDSDADFKDRPPRRLSDAESLSPPAKRARRPGVQRQQQRARGASTQRRRMTLDPAQPAREQAEREGSAEQRQGDAGEGEGSAGPGADRGPDTPAGFVTCPICTKTVPEFYINSHIDACLAGAGSQPAGAHAGPASGRRQQQQQQQQAGLGGGRSGTLGSKLRATSAGAAAPTGRPSQGGAGPSQQPQPAPPPAGPPPPFVPLAVPAKLVPNLTSEKALRGFLAKYGLPTDGKKKEMLERYNAMRLAVETANDRQECTSYQALARRIVRQRALAGAGPGGAAGALLARFQQPSGAPAAAAAGPPAGGGVEEAAAPMGSHTFEALIRQLRARMDAKKAARAAAAAAAAAEGTAAEQAGQPRPQQQQPAQQQQQREADLEVEAAAADEPEWSEPPPEEAERGEASTGGPPAAAGGEVAGGGVACGPSARPAVGFTPAQLLVLRKQIVALKTLQSLPGAWVSPGVLAGIQVPPLVLPVPAGAPDTAPAAAPGPAAAAAAAAAAAPSTRAGGSAAPAPVAAASSRAAARHTAGQWPASSSAEHPVEWWQKEGPEAMAVEDHLGLGPAGSSPPLSEGEEEHAGPWQPAAAPPAHKLPSPLSMLRHGSGGAGVPRGPVQGLSQPSPRDAAPGPACLPFQQQQQLLLRGDAPQSASGGLAAPCTAQQQFKHPQQQHQAPWARAPLREPNGGAGWQGDQAAGCAAPPAARGGSGSMNPMIDVLAEFGGVVPDSDSDW